MQTINIMQYMWQYTVTTFKLGSENIAVACCTESNVQHMTAVNWCKLAHVLAHVDICSKYGNRTLLYLRAVQIYILTVCLKATYE